MESNSGQKSPGMQRQNHRFHKGLRSKASELDAGGKVYLGAGKAPPLHVIIAGVKIQV
jgi:hypothetical protein